MIIHCLASKKLKIVHMYNAELLLSSEIRASGCSSFVIAWKTPGSCAMCNAVRVCVWGRGVVFPLMVCGSHDLLFCVERLSWHKLEESGWKITLLSLRFQPEKVVGTLSQSHKIHWPKMWLLHQCSIVDILGRALPTIRRHLPPQHNQWPACLNLYFRSSWVCLCWNT